MRYTLAALVTAFSLLFSAAAQAATSSETPAASATSSRTSAHLSQRAMKSTLRSDLKRGLAALRRLDLATVAAKGFTLKRVRALAAGEASVAATVPPPRRARQSAVRAGHATVGRGSRTFAGRGKGDVRLKLTRSGKKLLRGASRITLNVKATFTPRTGRRVSVSFKVTLKRKHASTPPNSPGTPVPSAPAPPSSFPIPANATLLYSQTFDSRAPWSGLSTQCAHPVEWGQESGDGYAHFEVRDGEPTVAGHERCEVSRGGFDAALPAGEYWYRTRARAGAGFPFGMSAEQWATLQQWQEDRPPPGGSTGTVDAAMFVNSGTERMFIKGEHVPILQSGGFGIHAWHDFVVHGVWTDQPTGYLEWWIDGTYVGRTTGVTSETGGRHFWKGGITRSSSLDLLQSADISTVQIYRAP